jgi:membrane protein DedA with SNARE-associated domain
MTAHINPVDSEVALLAIIFLAQALKEMGIPSLGLTHTLLLYAGYQLSSGNPSFGIVIILLTFLGSLCGASTIFFLARWRGDRFLAWLSLHGTIKAEGLARTTRILKASSFVTISIGRSIPGLMLPTSIVAGILDFPIPVFFSGILLTLSIWMAVIVTMGSTLKNFIPKIYISPSLLISLLGPLIVVYIISAILFKRQKELKSRIGKSVA